LHAVDFFSGHIDKNLSQPLIGIILFLKLKHGKILLQGIRSGAA